jgi:hypothetical protein
LNEYDNEKKFFRAISTEKITILVLTNERGYLNYEIEGGKIKIYLKNPRLCRHNKKRTQKSSYIYTKKYFEE